MVNLRRSVLYMVLQETVHVCSNPKEIKTGTLGLSELAIPVAWCTGKYKQVYCSCPLSQPKNEMLVDHSLTIPASSIFSPCLPRNFLQISNLMNQLEGHDSTFFTTLGTILEKPYLRSILYLNSINLQSGVIFSDCISWSSLLPCVAILAVILDLKNNTEKDD